MLPLTATVPSAWHDTGTFSSLRSRRKAGAPASPMAHTPSVYPSVPSV